MAPARTQRRLAAILAADVVGYSRLVRADEEGTLDRLKALRADLIDPKISEHRGRIVKLMGDGMLAEFSSVDDAVRAAAEIQQDVTVQNARLADSERIAFRVGINLGDVVIDGDDIHGDGVNVAARLEALAQPGGICVSGKVYEEIRDRTDLIFDDMGEQEIKNIDRLVRVWRWRMPGAPESPTTAATTLALPDKPSIAVLPFENMSSDPEQEFFGDGLAEDVITTLSKIASLFVIARNSSFAYKGQSTDVRQIARDLGVKHVLEGSVRAAAGRIRVSAQLIDAQDGHHIWAERYDRKVEDIFAIQDEITREIVTSLRIKLSDGEQAQLMLKGTESVEAWSYAMPALDLIMSGTPSGIAEGRRLLERALAADPDYASAHALIGFTHELEAHFGISDDIERSNRLTQEGMERARALDPTLAMVHLISALAAGRRGDTDEAVRSARRAIESSPNDPFMKMGAGRVLTNAGLLDEAETRLREAMRLNPFPPVYYFGILANALELQGRNEEALELLQIAVGRDPNYFSGHLRLASLLATLGRMGEARHHAEEARRFNPRFGRASIPAYYTTTNKAALAKFVDGLEKAAFNLD